MNTGISPQPIPARKNPGCYLLACWQAKRVYLSFHVFEFQSTFAYSSRWRIHTHNWWNGTRRRPTVRRYRWIEVFAGLDTRVAGTKSWTTERRRLEDIHRFGVAGFDLQGQFSIQACYPSLLSQPIFCIRRSMSWLTQANLFSWNLPFTRKHDLTYRLCQGKRLILEEQRRHTNVPHPPLRTDRWGLDHFSVDPYLINTVL